MKLDSPESTGLVIGIEHHPKLVEFAVGNLNSDDESMLSGDKLKIIQGDGRLGCPEHAPYDAIHVGAAAAEIPTKLFKKSSEEEEEESHAEQGSIQEQPEEDINEEEKIAKYTKKYGF
jgi:Protein-L-isoaspartate(D-aspartate) O-methyltransferase (PCMT)